MPKTKYTIAELKGLAAARWREILSTLGNCPAEILDGKHHPCPLCGGTDRFRMIDQSAGSLLCNQCFHEKNGDGLAALGWLRNWTFREAAERLAGWLGVQLDGRGGKRKKKADQEQRNPIFATLRDLVRITLTEIGRSLAAKGISQAAQFAASWQYDSFVVIRIDLPTPAGEKQRKTFRPCHIIELADGRKAWKLGYPPSTGKRPLYRREQLESAGDISLAIVVGGEKAADAAAKLGLVVTTCAGGEKAVAESDWSPLARFDRVIVSIDNDPAGCDFGQKVAKQLASICRNPTKVLELPGLPPCGDIVEWIAAGGTREKFLQLATSEAASSPDPLAGDRKLCEMLQIDVLGELPNRHLRVFSEHHGKMVTIERLAFLTYVDALQMFGPIVEEKVVEHGEIPPGMVSMNRVRKALAKIGGSEQAGTGIERGQGVWKGRTESDDTFPVLVLVGAGRAAIWDGQQLTSIKKPRAAGLKIDVGAPADSQWFDHDRLAGYLGLATDRQWSDATWTEAGNIFAEWNWRSKTEAVADLVTALVCCSFVQTVWSWRPFVSLIGDSDTGKSTLFELIESLLGPLALLSSKSTEAGIRQNVGHDAKVILCDEFESDKHRQAILELLRTSSKGSKTLRGTTGNQHGRVYGLRHLPWLAATEIEMARAPDRNRFIGLELKALPPGKRGKLKLPSEPALADLGQKLLALAVRHALAADALSLHLKTCEFPGIHGRVVESFSTPVSFLAILGEMNKQHAANLMGYFFKNLEQDPAQGTKDHTDLLGGILGSQVDLGHGDRATVGQILARPSSYTGGWQTLDRVGITAIADSPGVDAEVNESMRAGIFFATSQVSRYLLRSTKWDRQAIDQILRRVPGAKKCRQRAGGHRPWGVLVPWQLIRDRYLHDPEQPF